MDPDEDLRNGDWFDSLLDSLTAILEVAAVLLAGAFLVGWWLLGGN